MKETIEIYKNYGVLALEKRNVYTYGKVTSVCDLLR